MPERDAKLDESTVAPGSAVPESQSTLLQLVGFRLGGEEYCLNILQVQEIIRMQGLTHVPNAPESIEGVINLRGKVIPVFGLRKRFGTPPQSQSKDARIVIVDLKDEVLGFEVDSVTEVLRIPAEAVVPAPRLSVRNNEYISGVGKLGGRLLLLLDLNRLMDDVERREIANLSGPAAPSAAQEVLAK
ncbi:MAG TPA: chemotaxis protein CheW [Candidatus Acidoferrales bacterium]|nr:chemotaxis protein CheW [Candidatus Acidoferrales bacterium]